MAKTTKIIRGIHSWIKFQKHQGVQSLTIKGKESLADLSQDKNGDTDLILNADKDKINSISSTIPFITVTESTEGKDPNQFKKAGLDYDLTNFNIGSDGLIDISKSKDGITLYTSKIVDKINELISKATLPKGETPTQKPQYTVASGYVSLEPARTGDLSLTLEIPLDGLDAQDFIHNDGGDVISKGFMEIIFEEKYENNGLNSAITFAVNNTSKIVVPNFSGIVFINPEQHDKIYIKFNVKQNEHTHALYIKLYGLLNSPELKLAMSTDEYATGMHLEPAQSLNGVEHPLLPPYQPPM